MPSLDGVPVVKMTLIVVAVLLIFQRNKRFDGPQTYLLLGYVTVIFLSGVFNGWVGGGVTAAKNMLATAVLPFFVVANAVNSRKKQIVALTLLVVAALIMVSNGISQAAAPDGIGWAGVQAQGGGRAAYVGIFNDPNDLGMFLVMTLPVAFFLFAQTKNAFRVVFAVAAVALVYGVYLTNSRGALLGLGALAAFWFILRFGATRTTAIGLAMLPVAFFAISKFRAIDPTEQSAYGRIDAWYQGIQMLIGNPILGVGQDNFLDYHYLTAHNSFVLVFAELGMLGYFFWFAFVFFCVLGILVLWNKKIAEEFTERIGEFDKSLGKCLTFSMLGFLVTGFFLSRAYSPLLYIYCGLATATFYQAIPADQVRQFFGMANYGRSFIALYFGSIVTVFVAMKVLI